MRNTEIAAHLYVTVATVEAHLTRIYRKLGVRSRAGARKGSRLGAEAARWHCGASALGPSAAGTTTCFIGTDEPLEKSAPAGGGVTHRDVHDSRQVRSLK